MKKTILRTLGTVLLVLTLFWVLPTVASANSRTAIHAVEATTNLSQVAVLYGKTTTLDFTVTAGAPVYFSQTWDTCWETYNETTKVWENFSGRFVPGRYRVFAQLRIDGEDAKTYKLDKNVTCTVDGAPWTVELVSVSPTYCTAFATSPEIVIVDDPSVTPPTIVTELSFAFEGYVAGGKFSECKLRPHLGSEAFIEIKGDLIFLDMTDGNGDGLPDSVDLKTGTFTPPDDEIRTDLPYMLAFTFSAKEGYDLAELTQGGIKIPARLSNPAFDKMPIGYIEETGLYQVFMLLSPCAEQRIFTECPEDTVAWSRNGEGSVEVHWAVDGEVSKYQIYKWDEEDGWDVMPFTNVFDTSYVFECMDGASAGRYRIEAIFQGETVAVSGDFTLSWEEVRAVTLPIRVDASSAVGSKTPVDLSAYFRESTEYEFLTGGEYPSSCWVDFETGKPTDHFEHGKKYAYSVCVTPRDGYYFEFIDFMPLEDPRHPDVCRIHGIGWERVDNVFFEEENLYYAAFVFTYDESVGIPAESERILQELVFDASPIVGMDTPTAIPDAVFVHDGLTLCKEGCDCTAVPDVAKQIVHRWLDVGRAPVDAFVPDTPYFYMFCFHVEEGWEIPGRLNGFDLVISGVSLDVVELVYSPERQVLAVTLGFLCGESGKIEAGEHACIRQKIDAVSPTCTEKGSLAYYSCACGKLWKDRWGMYALSDPATECAVDATGHTFDGAWTIGDGKHWRACECGEASEAEEHTDADGDKACDACAAEIADSDASRGLGTGAIVGIVIGAVVLLGGGGFCVYFFVIRKKKTEA